MTRALAALGFAAVLAGCSGPEAMRSDWEIEHAAKLAKEGADALPELPRAPVDQELVALRVDGLSGYRLFIDPLSLAVGEGIVRYSLVARSASGASNTTYEALNCRSGEYRLFASGRADGQWAVQRSPWREVGRRPIQRALMRDFFCPEGIAIATAAEGAAALRRGGHPRADAPNPLGGSR